jgi:hypothetical protein
MGSGGSKVNNSQLREYLNKTENQHIKIPNYHCYLRAFDKHDALKMLSRIACDDFVGVWGEYDVDNIEISKDMSDLYVIITGETLHSNGEYITAYYHLHVVKFHPFSGKYTFLYRTFEKPS